MKKQSPSPQSGHGAPLHPLWMRLLTIFCMALLGVGSTVQVFHSHDDAFACGLVKASLSGSNHRGQRVHPAGQPGAPDAKSAIPCPLCVAMHSALPVAHRLIEIAMLRFEPPPVTTSWPPRLFLWRFELASRPPPGTQPLAWPAAASIPA